MRVATRSRLPTEVIEPFVENNHRLKQQFSEDLEVLKQAVEKARTAATGESGPEWSDEEGTMLSSLQSEVTALLQKWAIDTAVLQEAEDVSALPSPAAEPRAKSRRQRDGEETRQTAKKIRRLQSQGQVAQADQVQSTIEDGRSLQERTVRLRAKALADLLFETGKWGATKQVLESFLGRGEVQALQSEEHRSSAADRHRLQAKDLMIESATTFIYNCLTHSLGRRTEQDTNTFWAILAALVPDGVFDQRLGAAVGSLLGLNYRAVRKALSMRLDVQDSAAGWVFVQTSRHFDSIELKWMSEWLHAQGTTERQPSASRATSWRRGGGSLPVVGLSLCRRMKTQGPGSTRS